MDRDVLMMVYGVLLGAVSSMMTSLVTATFQYWLERREYERRQQEEQRKRIHLIYLPTEEEVRLITAQHHTKPEDSERNPELPRTAVEVGSIAFSIVMGSLLIYQKDNPHVSFIFAAILGFLVTNLVTKLKKR